MNGTADMIEEIKYLQEKVTVLNMEVLTLKERMNDIKPFVQYAKEREDEENDHWRT